MSTPYLSQAVGVPLTQCLCELTERCPRDPIEWIAQWLYRYIDKELYFYEKAIFLKDLHRMRMELDKENQSRQRVVNSMNANIFDLRKQAKEDENAMADLMLKKLTTTDGDADGEGGGRRGRGKGGKDGMFGGGRGWGEDDEEEEELNEYERQRRAMKKLAKELGMRPSEMTDEFFANNPELLNRLTEIKKSVDKQSISGLGGMKGGRRWTDAGWKDGGKWKDGWKGPVTGFAGLNVLNVDTPEGRRYQKEMQRMAATCTWCLDCDMGLVCNHSILGKLRARCALVKHETPEWWENKGFLLENLYDHEVYTTNFSDFRQPHYSGSGTSIDSATATITSRQQSTGTQ